MAIRNYQGNEPRIHEAAYIDQAATVIGKVQIGAQSSLWPMTVARGDVNTIEIGRRTNIQDGCVLHVTHDGPYSEGGFPLIVGDDVTVGHNVTLHACAVESGCLIGMGSIVMDGAVIKSGAIVGAGALVPPGKTLEGGYLWIGSPVKRARSLTAEERESILYSAKHYTQLAEKHRQEQPESVDDMLPYTFTD